MKLKIFCLFLFVNIYSEQFGGEWVLKTQENIRVDYTPVRVDCQKLNYFKGGIVIKYPQNLFSSKPCIYVSIELNKLKYSSDLIFSPIIIAKNLDDITIFINKHSPGYIYNSMVEADDDDVIVNIFSFGK